MVKLANKHPWHSVRLSDKTVESLKSLDITVSWVDLETYEQKINHLIWYYKSYKNNNIKS